MENWGIKRMMESHRRGSGIMNPAESRSLSQVQSSCFCCRSQCSGHLPPPNLGNAPAPGSEGALCLRAAAAYLLSKLHQSISTFSRNICPAQCLISVHIQPGQQGAGGGGAFAEVLKGITLTRERRRTRSQETHMNKLFDLG